MIAINSFKIPAQHPCLQGHFPNHPIVPGVVLLEHIDTMLQKHLTDWKITELIQVKFLQLVLPEDVIQLYVNSSKLESHHSIEFQLIHIETQVRVAIGTLKLTELIKGK